MSPGIVRTEIANRLAVDPSLRKLNDYLKTTLGLTPVSGDEGFAGLKSQFIQRPRLFWEKERRVQKELYIQAFGSPKGDKIGALVQVVVTGSEGQEEKYSFILVSPPGKYENADEYTVDERGAVVKASSWRSCMLEHLPECGSRCADALKSCGGNPAQYFVCLAWRCGGCFLKVSACCICNCRLWCKWAVGCCHR